MATSRSFVIFVICSSDAAVSAWNES